jgi:MarR family
LTASPLEAHLGYWLRLVSNEVSHAFERALHKQGISVAEWVAMNRLAAGTELTPAKLAATMGMTRGAVSKILDKLDSKNFFAALDSGEKTVLRNLLRKLAGFHHITRIPVE